MIRRTIFVYEYCCALGLGRDVGSPEHALYLEGRAMRDAVAADLRSLGHTVLTLEGEPETEEASLRRLSKSSQFSIIIAPEFERILEVRASWIPEAKRVGPTLDAIRLTADKLALAEHWTKHGVRTPRTLRATTTPPNIWPCVLKPRDGCGSTATYLCQSPTDWETHLQDSRRLTNAEMLVQEHISGQAVSVSLLLGTQSILALQPATQSLSADGRFQYGGGELPLLPPLAKRAQRLALQALAHVSGLRGYVGVDLILGSDESGEEDYAIEINPRFTTSYIGLRALAETNLMEAMLALHCGEPVKELRWKPGTVRFHADGRVGI